MAYTEKKILNWKENNKVEEIEKILSNINSLYNERIFAINTLAEINNTSSIEPLKKVIENDSVKIVVEAAIKAIEIIGLTPEISALIDKRMQEFKIKEEKSAQIKDELKVKSAKELYEEMLSDVTRYGNEKLLSVIENTDNYEKEIIEKTYVEIEKRGGKKILLQNIENDNKINNLKKNSNIEIKKVKKKLFKVGLAIFIPSIIISTLGAISMISRIIMANRTNSTSYYTGKVYNYNPYPHLIFLIIFLVIAGYGFRLIMKNK